LKFFFPLQARICQVRFELVGAQVRWPSFCDLIPRGAVSPSLLVKPTLAGVSDLLAIPYSCAPAQLSGSLVLSALKVGVY